MKKNKLFLLVALFAAFVLVLTACGERDTGGTDGTEPAGTEQVGTEPAATEPGDDVVEAIDSFAALEAALVENNLTMETQNPNAPLEGGVLRFALGATSVSMDSFEAVFWRFSTEADIREFSHEPLLFVGEDFNPASNVNSLASAEFDRDSRTVTITKDNPSTWADGEPLTLDDLVFAFEVIGIGGTATAHRRNAQYFNVVGTQAFVDGDVDYIAGLTLSDDEMELTIEFYEVDPYTFAFGFWTTPMPRHHWGDLDDIEILAEDDGCIGNAMLRDPRSRENVLGNGPFMISAIVPEESVHFVRNDNFWRGPANLDEIIFEVVDPMTAPDVMRAGMYDVMNFPQSLFTAENREALTNVSFLANPFAGNASWWLGFRMGDHIDGENVPWDEPRLSAPVRTALALSIDHLGASTFFNGLVVPSGSVYWPLNRLSAVDRTLPTYNNFDMDRARQILDDAGYTFPYDGAEFRTRPDGSELVVIYAAQTGSQANINNRELELDNWRLDLGIDVRLYQDRLVEGGVFWEAMDVEVDSPVDMFTFGTGFGANPGSGVDWNTGLNSPNNLTRFTSPEWQEAQARFTDERMWDAAFSDETLQIWQQVMIEAQVMFPTTTAIGLTAVNNRVTNFSVENTFGDQSRAANWNTWLWALTAEEAYVAN